MSLHGKTALVTGSTGGIGFAVAKALAAAGCDVVITGFGAPAQIESWVQELRDAHAIRAMHIAADVSKPDEIRALIASAAERFGAIDILVNNAGVQHVAPLEAFAEQKWDEIIAINLSAAFHATKAVLPGMKRKGWGRIVNVASAHGLVASVGKSAYVAAKHGLVGLTKVIALENASFGITANAVCPGWVRTPLAEKQVEERAMNSGRSLRQEEARMIGEKQAIPSFTTPGQVADFVAFLCADSAATITGAALPIDGGWVAQ